MTSQQLVRLVLHIDIGLVHEEKLHHLRRVLCLLKRNKRRMVNCHLHDGSSTSARFQQQTPRQRQDLPYRRQWIRINKTPLKELAMDYCLL